MQEALIKTYRYVGRIREPGAFRPWLYRTVRNACLMGRRKRAGEPARLQSLDEVLPGPRRSDAPRTRRIQGRIRNSWRTTPRSVVACERRLRTLPGPYRAIVFLREMEGLSTREVAKVMGMSEDNVKTRLHRARVQLQADSREETRNDRSGPPVRALPHAVAGVVALSGRRPDARPSADDRTAHRGVRVLPDDGRTLAEDRGRLPRRREEAAAPRRDVAGGGPDQGAGGARGAARRCRPAPGQSPARLRDRGPCLEVFIWSDIAPSASAGCAPPSWERTTASSPPPV